MRIPYPNVPNVPGVPQVLRRLPAGPPPILASAAGVTSLVRAFASKNEWGVFKHQQPSTGESKRLADGSTQLPEVVVVAKRAPVVNPDSFIDFDYTKEVSVSTAPTQTGGFADFNRVNIPNEIKLRMFKGGGNGIDFPAGGLRGFINQGVDGRKKFLEEIDALDTTQLYDIFTPEKTYLRVNFVRAEIARRGEKGAYQLVVDVYFREIRPVAATYTKTVIANPTNPDSSQQQNNGTQQGVVTAAAPPPSVTR